MRIELRESSAFSTSSGTDTFTIHSCGTSRPYSSSIRSSTISRSFSDSSR